MFTLHSSVNQQACFLCIQQVDCVPFSDTFRDVSSNIWCSVGMCSGSSSVSSRRKTIVSSPSPKIPENGKQAKQLLRDCDSEGNVCSQDGDDTLQLDGAL